jgi:hypothetical protein
MPEKQTLGKVWIGCVALACGAFASLAQARGPSPYLPLNLSPEIERQIERVLILAGKPVMSRPIAAAVVLDALPEACRRDRVLCDQVDRYLRRYMQPYGITGASAEAAISQGDSTVPLPNRHGRTVDSSWQIAASGYLQLGDHIILNAGGVAFDGDATATGSFISAGFDFAQLDIGYRDHWWSPLTDSSSLISTESSTMPSVTVSNYKPLTPLGITYQVFGAVMSHQDGISYLDGETSGHPRLAGLQVGVEPVTGWGLTFNRISQYGGGARSESEGSDFWDALLDQNNAPDAPGVSAETGNRVASLASSILFPGKVPFAVHAEYAGEDNAYAGNRLLGATNFSVGLDFPQLPQNLDATFEISEWQNDWYVHHLYPDGLTNHGSVIGHWFGDERQFGDAIGGNSQMVRAGWYSPSGSYWQARYRTMQLDTDWRRPGSSGPSYGRMQSLSISLSTQFRSWPVNAELQVGEDVLGDSFARLGASMDFSGFQRGAAPMIESDEDSHPEVDYFVDIGVVQAEVTKILAVDIPDYTTDAEQDAHVAFGVRRPVAKRSDIGVRLEWDRVDGHQLISFRAVDYRLRMGRKFAVNAFFGVGRYDVDLPCYGYYWGAGLQYRDILPKWDLSLDWREHYKMGRDKTALPDDPPSTWDRTRMFFDVNSYALYLSRRW